MAMKLLLRRTPVLQNATQNTNAQIGFGSCSFCTVAQLCDATGDDHRNAAGLKITALLFNDNSGTTNNQGFYLSNI